MTLSIFLHVVAEFETTVTQSTMLCNLPGMAFHVYCLVIPDAPPEYFIHQESSLPAKCLQQGQKLLSIAGLPLPIPSTRNHLVLLQGVFNMARILLGNAGPPLTIPSTSNHPFLCQGTFNKARIMLDIANLPLTIPSTRNHHFHVYSAKIMLVIAGLSFTVPSIRNLFSYSTASTGQGSVGCWVLPAPL